MVAIRRVVGWRFVAVFMAVFSIPGAGSIGRIRTQSVCPNVSDIERAGRGD
jgi:hypothetical protein